MKSFAFQPNARIMYETAAATGYRLGVSLLIHTHIERERERERVIQERVNGGKGFAD